MDYQVLHWKTFKGTIQVSMSAMPPIPLAPQESNLLYKLKVMNGLPVLRVMQQLYICTVNVSDY